jgi:hypothetical protein
MQSFVALALFALAAAANARPHAAAPLVAAASEERIQGKYIVKMRETSAQGLTSHHAWLLGKVEASEDSEITHFYEMDEFKVSCQAVPVVVASLSPRLPRRSHQSSLPGASRSCSLGQSLLFSSRVSLPLPPLASLCALCFPKLRSGDSGSVRPAGY